MGSGHEQTSLASNQAALFSGGRFGWFFRCRLVGGLRIFLCPFYVLLDVFVAFLDVLVALLGVFVAFFGGWILELESTRRRRGDPLFPFFFAEVERTLVAISQVRTRLRAHDTSHTPEG